MGRPIFVLVEAQMTRLLRHRRDAVAPGAGTIPGQRQRIQPHLPSTFRALRHRNYRLFFFGQMISLVGTWMQTIAQQWLVFRLTGSMTMLGTVSLLGALPLIPLSLWGGSLADRFAKRSIILVTQSAMMGLALVMAGLTWAGRVQVWHVLVLSVALGAANAIDIPARQAFVVEMVEGKDDLTNAIGLNSTIFNAARAVGPALAGVAVATTGEAGAFLINGVTFLAVIGALLMMRLPDQPRTATQRGLGSHLAEAVGYVRSQQIALVLIGLVAASAFLSMPYSTLLPVFASQVLRESAQPLLDAACTGSRALFSCQSPDALTYGLLMAATGVGAVMGALFVASLPDKARRGRWLTLGNLGFPALVVVMALSRSFALTLVVLVGIGFSFVAQNALANTLIQLAVPDALRGRVMSFYSLTFQSMMRLGGMQAGVMGDTVGAPLAVGLGGIVCLGYGAFVAWRHPRIRQLA
jgi:MFS family permease